LDPRNLPGSLKVAILVQSLSTEAAHKLMRGLSDEERSLVAGHMSQMGPISPDLVETVSQEFVARLKNIHSMRLASKTGSARQGRARANDIKDSEDASLNAILALEPDQLYNLIKDEHPQTIAIVLVHLDTAVASEVLSNMPDEIKTDVAIRIANLDKVVSGMVNEINNVFEEILKNKDNSVTRITGGVDRLAEILNLTDELSSELVLNEIEDTDADLAARIKQKMFVFEDLTLVDDRGFQKLLRRVETTELAGALKAASEEVKDKVFRNMSARAGEMLREEIDDLGPVRMKDVSDAQQKITALIQEMEAKGELIISGRRGEELIA